MNKWQPIETAPKDGTRILVFDPAYETRMACASYDKYSQWVERGYDYATEVWGSGEMNPTHWMKLPDAP